MRGWTCRTPGCESNGARCPEPTFCSLCQEDLKRMTYWEQLRYFIRNPEIIGNPECPLILRWTLLETGRKVEDPSTPGRFIKGGPKLMVHRFTHKDDRDAAHDHPRGFWTLVLRGGYDDWVPCPTCNGRNRVPDLERDGYVVSYLGCPDCRDGFVTGDRMRAGMLRYRPATYAHRTQAGPEGAWTIVLMGPLERAWGFRLDGGWMNWRDYLDRFGNGMRCE